MGYEVWDRYERAFLGDFDTEAQALGFLHDIVRSLTVDDAARQLDRYQIVEVTNHGKSTKVKTVGVDLMTKIFAPEFVS